MINGSSGKVTKSCPCCFAGCVQLEYLLELERRQHGGLENSKRELEGDFISVPKSLWEMENKSGWDELIKRSNIHTSKLVTIETISRFTHSDNLPNFLEIIYWQFILLSLLFLPAL